MKKPMKIKRYKKIYSSNNPFASPLSIVITVALLLSLGFIGWFAYPPIYDAVMSFGTEKEPKPPVSQASEPVKPTDTNASSMPAETPSTSTPAQSSETTPVAPPVVTTPNGMKAVYAPHNILSDTTKLDEFLKSIKGSYVNTVVVEGKSSDGYLLYRTQLEGANARQATDAFDPKTVASKIKEAGFTPMIIIEAFKDPLYARAERTAAVTYMDSDFTWLDNSPDLGGRPWLNPYSETARSYILSVGCELAACGFEQVALNSVQFPSGVGQDKARYGASGNGPSLAPLNSFIAEAEKAFAEKGAKTSVIIPGTLALRENALLYGGDPLSLTASGLIIEMIATNFPANTDIGGTIIGQPSNEYSNLVSTLSNYINGKCGEKSLTAILSGTNPDQTLLSQTNLESQIKALHSDFDGYIVMNRSGKYTVSGIK